MPQHGLIARDAWLAGGVFDLFDDVQGAQRTAADEDRIGVGSVEADGEVPDVVGCDPDHVGVVRDVEALQVEDFAAPRRHVLVLDLVDLVEVRGADDDAPGTDVIERGEHPGDQRGGSCRWVARPQFVADRVLAHDHAATGARVADDVEVGVGSEHRCCRCERVDHGGERLGGDLVGVDRTGEVHADALGRPAHHVAFNRLLARQQDEPELRPREPAVVELDVSTHGSARSPAALRALVAESDAEVEQVVVVQFGACRVAAT